MQRGFISIVCVFGILLLGLCLVIFVSRKKLRRPDSQTGTPTKTSVMSVTPTLTSYAKNFTDELLSWEYNNVRDELIAVVDRKDPKAALEVLAKRIETDPKVLRACHPLVHEIGRRAYKKYQDFTQAMNYLTDLCNTGYLHGVVEQYFDSTPTDIFTAMKSICTTAQTAADQVRCYHGVGHGLMYFTANDLPKSLILCRSYTNVAHENCAQGVFMENFNTDRKLHPSEYLKENDPFYPCNEPVSASYKAICYYYAPRFYVSVHHDAFREALAWCQTGDEEYQSSCENGLGAVTMKLLMHKPKDVENICMSGAPSQIRACIDGMVGYYVYSYNSIEKGKALCELLDQSNKDSCYSALNGRPELLRN